MVKSHNFLHFQRHRSDRSEDLLFGLVTSILLHIILFLGSSYWLRAFTPKQKQDLSQSIPIEYVEVPPNQTKTPPPETSRRAANDSVAGGSVKLKSPVSAAKSAPVAPKVSASEPAKAFLPKLTQPTAVSPQKPQPKPQKIAVAPATIRPAPKPQQKAVTPATIPPETKPPKTAVTPDTTPLAPKLPKTAVTPATTPLAPKLPKTAVAPATTPLAPKPPKTAVTPATTPLAPKPPKIAVTPATTPPGPLTRQENNNRLATKSTNQQLETKATPRTLSQVQSSQKSAASSRLGAQMSVSSRNFGGNDLGGLPNSNRLNRAEEGVDARQDDRSAYWEQLKQRVRPQWTSELIQSSRPTVIHFIVNRSGQVSNFEIKQSSGFSDQDEAAINAIKRVAPFAPLPVAYTGNYAPFDFVFTPPPR